MSESSPSSYSLPQLKCQPILERFDEAWREAIRRFEPPPNMAAFLPADENSPLRAKALAPLAEIDLQKRIPYRRLLSFLSHPIPDGWRGDDEKEELVRRFPELSRSRKALRMLMIADRQTRLTFERGYDGNKVALFPCPAPAPESPFASVWDDALAKKLQGMRPSRGRYKVFWKIDEGGFGEVFWVYDRQLRRWDVAKKIKTLDRADRQRRSRLIREARIAGRLDHPGIAPVHAIARDAAGHPYYVMRYAAGETLRDRIERAFERRAAGTLSLDQFLWERRALLRHLVDVCHVVQYAHSRKVVHRDLKPSNIRIRDHATIVVDWGLAKEEMPPSQEIAVGSATPVTPASSGSEPTPATMKPRTQAGEAEWTQTQGLIGTLIYMSPEQASGESKRVQPASDIYSLGATLYHLLTGSAPFDGAFEEIRARILRGDFKRPRKACAVVSRSLEAICLKAMAFQPADRYANAQELAQDLERDLASLPVTAYKEPITDRVGRWLWRHRDWASPIGVAAVLLIILGLAAAQRVAHARIEARVASVETIPPQDAPGVIGALRENPTYAARLLEARWGEVHRQGEPLGPAGRQIAFALETLRDDGALAAELAAAALDAPFSELLALRDLAARHPERSAPPLWQALEDSNETPRRRFQAACALAAHPDVRNVANQTATTNLAPEANRWARHAALITDESLTLLEANPAFYSELRRLLAPAGSRLLSRLQSILANPEQGEGAKLIAGNLLTDFCGEATAAAAEALMADIPRPVRDHLWTLLQASPGPGIAALERETRQTPGWLDNAPQLEGLASRQAKAALMLARLGYPEAFHRGLSAVQTPSTRSQMIEQAQEQGIESTFLLRALEQEPNAAARQALLFMLGDCDPNNLPAKERVGLESKLRDWFAADPDPGVHSAIQWLWRRWGRQDQEKSALAALAASSKAAAAIQTSDPSPIPARRSWMVTPSGLTFVTSPPIFFTQGSWSSEKAVSHELRHRVHIPRTFAISACEIDGRLFAQFLQNHPNAASIRRAVQELDSNHPVLGVDWHRAAEFCRWLSELEGIPDEECCYPRIEVIEASRQSSSKLDLPPNFLERTGYRLPTESEWECACRAGTDSPRFFGWEAFGLSSYARYSTNPNPEDQTLEVGSLKPNPWGFFDILGNAGEWVQDPFTLYPLSLPGRSVSDASPDPTILPHQTRVIRGGSYSRTAPYLRSAARQALPPFFNHRDTGFRIARTIRTAKPTPGKPTTEKPKAESRTP